MMMRAVMFLNFVALLSAAGRPVFEIADVHVSPRTDWVKKVQNNMQGGLLNAGRYELRRATMLDMIRIAYGVDADKVYGGPSWLDYDRYEVIAQTPDRTRPEVLKQMLQSLLEERFKLVAKPDTKPVPGFVLSVNGTAKLKPSEGAGAGCQNQPPVIKEVPYGHIQCRNVTMEAFAAALRRMSAAAFGNLPVVDATGLEGTWDIDLQYPLIVQNLNGGTVTALGSGNVIDAVEKLGLKLEKKDVPQPVLVVESVNEQPTPNAPDVAAKLPPLPSPELEVAAIRPCDGTGPSINARFEAGGRVTARCMPLVSLITQSWGLAPLQQLTGAPKWLSTAPNITIEGKAAAGSYTDAQGNPDRDVLNAMIRALLIDRYKMKLHYEDRPVDAYTLVAVKPKLTKADPSARTGCTRQPQPGGELRLVCQNMTMGQFAEQIEAYNSGEIFYPVQDGTGLEGSWDFTVTFSTEAGPQMQALLAQLRANAIARSGAAPAAEPAEPSRGVSFAEAIEKQLGVKLELHKRPEPVLILDHIEEKPTEN